MNPSGWFFEDMGALFAVVLTGLGLYGALLVFTRMVGLRSFSKMSSFDFAITVAVGSVIATTLLTKKPPLAAGVVGLGMMYGIQYTVARLRRRWPRFASLVDNEPLLLMAGDQVLFDNLAIARVTLEDLRAKLRLAGITHADQVLAVVMETTGDVAVLERRERVDPALFSGVRGREAMAEVTTAQRRTEPRNDPLQDA